MRLRNIKDIGTANNFLEEYLPIFNSKFNVIPFDSADVNVKIGGEVDLDSYLCIKKQRVVKNDNTISYNTKIYQLKPIIIRAKMVTACEHIDGSIHIKYNGTYLDHKEIMQRPIKSAEKVVGIKKKYIPPSDHPWRQTFKKYFKHKTLQMADEK